MQRRVIADPVSGRVTVIGVPSTSQVPLVRNPSKSTSMAAEEAAVVGSTTVTSRAGADDCDAFNVITSSETSNGTMMNGTGFENCGGIPGFSNCRVIVAADCRSDGLSTVVQLVVVAWHVVARATPFMRITPPAFPLPGTKFAPSTVSGKLSTAPAITLEGKIVSITGPEVIAIAAADVFVVSATLVATIEIAFGLGATAGAVYSPFASTEPQAEPPQPSPGTPVWTLHVTFAFVVPVTVAKNWLVLGVPSGGGTNAYKGAIAIDTGVVTATVAVPLFEGSAWLTAVRTTGSVAGNDAGAR